MIDVFSDLNISWFSLLVVSIFISAIANIWAVFDLSRLKKLEGDMVWGIKVGKRALSKEAYEYLSLLSEDVIETRNIFFVEKVIGFIRVKNGKATIYKRSSPWGRTWPYIGCVNLMSSDRHIEFRSSLPLFLALLPFFVSVVLIPLVILAEVQLDAP